MSDSRAASNRMVSVITPVYNSASFVGEAIESVLAQTYTNWEMILVDDCSTDESAAIAESYAERDGRVRLYRLSENSGAAVSRNTALQKANGRYIAYLDADDIWLPEKLSRQIEFLAAHDAGFTCCDYECIDTDGTSLKRIVHMPATYTYEQLLKNTVILTVGVMADTEYVPKDLLVMPDIRRGQDSATWMQVLAAGIRFYGQNEVLARYRRAPGSLSSNPLNSAKRTWHLLRHVEKLPFIKACWCMANWSVHAAGRRVFLFDAEKVTRNTKK